MCTLIVGSLHRSAFVGAGSNAIPLIGLSAFFCYLRHMSVAPTDTCPWLLQTVQGQYVYWITMSHPKEETVRRLGLKVPSDFSREEFSKFLRGGGPGLADARPGELGWSCGVRGLGGQWLRGRRAGGVGLELWRMGRGGRRRQEGWVSKSASDGFGAQRRLSFSKCH